MIKLYADDNFEFPVVKRLREKGYDVLTTREAGKDKWGHASKARRACLRMIWQSQRFAKAADGR
jgi:Domain of unknown function (DUF5615)